VLRGVPCTSNALKCAAVVAVLSKLKLAGMASPCDRMAAHLLRPDLCLCPFTYMSVASITVGVTLVHRALGMPAAVSVALVDNAGTCALVDMSTFTEDRHRRALAQLEVLLDAEDVRLLQQTAHVSANMWTQDPDSMTWCHVMCTLYPEQGPTPGLFGMHVYLVATAVLDSAIAAWPHLLRPAAFGVTLINATRLYRLRLGGTAAPDSRKFLPLVTLSQTIIRYLHSVGCDNPGCNERGLKRCGRCFLLKYCSSVCQKAAWAGHKSECVSVIGTA
jgi:hypothetical protein